MGQLVFIKAKDTADLNKLNSILAVQELSEFTTDKDTEDWLKDINTNPQSHLKPKDRDLTMVELREIFPCHTETGLLQFDVAFERTDEKTAKTYLQFIKDNQDDIEYIQGALEFCTRFIIDNPKDRAMLKKFNKVDPEPVKLPKSEQTNNDLQSGLFLCKSWSSQPFWIIFGNVDSPRFMKKRIYENDLYNNLYRDNKGYAYMLFPLLSVNNNQVDFVQKVYNEAIELGLRENFNFIIPLIYGLNLTNYREVCKDYQEFYTEAEICQRFTDLFLNTERTLDYNNYGDFVWSDARKCFKPRGNMTMLMQSKCSIMTCLVWAMGNKKAAELMSNITGQKYLPFEFNIPNPKSTKV